MSVNTALMLFNSNFVTHVNVQYITTIILTVNYSADIVEI